MRTIRYQNTSQGPDTTPRVITFVVSDGYRDSNAGTTTVNIVAINDAGALAYFSGHRTIDLIGLTTPGFAGLWPAGCGALWRKP